MTPQAVNAWINVAKELIAIGVPVFSSLHGWLTASHPTLTPDQTNAAYVAILSDDAVRAAFASRVVGAN